MKRFPVHNNEVLLWYGTPLWAVLLLMFVCLAFACGLVVVALNYEQWMANDPIFFKYLFYVMAAVFFMIGLKPGNWKPWTYFIATADGLHFPSSIPQTSSSDWLLVPWYSIGSIEVVNFIGHSTGPSMEIKIPDQDRDRFFPTNSAAHKFFNTQTSHPDFIQIGYSNAFCAKERVVKRLNELKKQFS